MDYSSLARAIAAGILLASLHTLGNAETVNTIADLSNNTRIEAYIYASPMREWLNRLGAEQDKKFGLQQECKFPYQVEPHSISILQPIDFPNDKQHPVKGMFPLPAPALWGVEAL